DDINTYQSSYAKAVLLSEPTDALTIRLAAHWQNDHAGAAPLVNPLKDPDKLEIDYQTSDDYAKEKILVVPLKIRYDFGSVGVESISGYFTQDSNSYRYEQISALFASIVLNPLVTGRYADGHALTDSSYRQYTQEFRLISDFEGPVNFIL